MLLLVIGTAGGGEALVRARFFGIEAVIHPGRYRPVGLWRPAFVGPADDAKASRIGYRLRPSLSTSVNGRRFSTNRHGFRERHVALQKPAGVCRLAVLGNSVTAGVGVHDEEVYSRQLQELLEARDSGHYQVLNFGIMGYTQLQVVASYEHLAKDFEPDLVMLQVDYGDLGQLVQETPPAHAPQRSTWPTLKLVSASFLYEAIQSASRRWLTKYGAVDWAARGQAPPSGQRRLRVDEMLAGFVADRHQEGIPVVILSLHLLDEGPLDQPPWAAMRSRLETWVNDRPGCYLIDTHPRLDGRVGTHDSFYPGNLHPNARVHRLYAEAIAQELPPLLTALGLEPRMGRLADTRTEGR